MTYAMIDYLNNSIEEQLKGAEEQASAERDAEWLAAIDSMIEDESEDEANSVFEMRDRHAYCVYQLEELKARMTGETAGGE